MEVVAIARAGCESLVVVVIVVVVSLPLGNVFLHYRSLCVCLKVQRESYLVKFGGERGVSGFCFYSVVLEE